MSFGLVATFGPVQPLGPVTSCSNLSFSLIWTGLSMSLIWAGINQYSFCMCCSLKGISGQNDFKLV